MSECYICGAPMDEVKLDPRDNKPMPCGTCLEEIKDALEYWNEETIYTSWDDSPGLEDGIDGAGDGHRDE